MLAPIKSIITLFLATPVRARCDGHKQSCTPPAVQAPTLIQQKQDSENPYTAAKRCQGISGIFTVGLGTQHNCRIPVDPQFKTAFIAKSDDFRTDWDWCVDVHGGELYLAGCMDHKPDSHWMSEVMGAHILPLSDLATGVAKSWWCSSVTECFYDGELVTKAELEEERRRNREKEREKEGEKEQARGEEQLNKKVRDLETQSANLRDLLSEREREQARGEEQLNKKVRTLETQSANLRDMLSRMQDEQQASQELKSLSVQAQIGMMQHTMVTQGQLKQAFDQMIDLNEGGIETAVQGVGALQDTVHKLQQDFKNTVHNLEQDFKNSVHNLEQDFKNFQKDDSLQDDMRQDSMRQHMKANWAAGGYVFMGHCKNGQLVEESKRTADDQCGQCDVGYELTVGDSEGSPPTCERKVACQCTGRSNQFKCSDGHEGHCANSEVCYLGTDESFTKDAWHEGCKLASCQCTGSSNQFRCSDGTVSSCSSDQACFRKKDELWTIGKWDEGCKVACYCTGHLNQFKCSDGHEAYCASHQKCVRNTDEWWYPSALGEACQ